MQISVFCEDNSEVNFSYTLENIENYASKMLEFAITNSYSEEFTAANDYSFDILLCDDNFIHEINMQYRKKDAPTDVITFALYADSEDKIIQDNRIALGQIIISMNKVFAQAKENTIVPEEEFLNLLSHGILHLIGFTHEDDKALTDMLELQSKMIESIKNV